MQSGEIEIMKNFRLIGIVSAVLLILLVPLVAMQFTAEVKWSAMDFVVAAVLLFGAGLMCELVLRIVKATGSRIAICVGILLVFALVWIELAVGLFGTPFAGS